VKNHCLNQSLALNSKTQRKAIQQTKRTKTKTKNKNNKKAIASLPCAKPEVHEQGVDEHKGWYLFALTEREEEITLVDRILWSSWTDACGTVEAFSI
jgi:hypothetical protein